MNLTDKQLIEVFHLVFLRSLKTNLDSSLYAIKGGGNLRFFFESIRYSEDIDLDIAIISKETLKKKIDTILLGVPIRQGLSRFGIEIDQISTPKQTDTVQRWKIGIKAKNKVMNIPTKIEFSRRMMESDRKAEPITNSILQDYQIQPLILPHYLYATAVKQKINALIHRAQTQARDVFDLNLLFSKKMANKFSFSFDIEKAIDCVLGVSFEDYSSQVVTYLIQEYIEYYQNKQVWDDMKIFVMDNLNKCYETD